MKSKEEIKYIISGEPMLDDWRAMFMRDIILFETFLGDVKAFYSKWQLPHPARCMSKPGTYNGILLTFDSMYYSIMRKVGDENVKTLISNLSEIRKEFKEENMIEKSFRTKQLINSSMVCLSRSYDPSIAYKVTKTASDLMGDLICRLGAVWADTDQLFFVCEVDADEIIQTQLNKEGLDIKYSLYPAILEVVSNPKQKFLTYI